MLDAVNTPWPLLTVLLTVSVGVYAWIAAIRKGLDDRCTETEQELAVLGERIKHLPSAKEIAELTAATQRLTVEMASAVKSIDALAHRLELHEEWFTEHERRVSA